MRVKRQSPAWRAHATNCDFTTLGALLHAVTRNTRSHTTKPSLSHHHTLLLHTATHVSPRRGLHPCCRAQEETHALPPSTHRPPHQAPPHPSGCHAGLKERSFPTLHMCARMVLVDCVSSACVFVTITAHFIYIRKAHNKLFLSMDYIYCCVQRQAIVDRNVQLYFEGQCPLRSPSGDLNTHHSHHYHYRHDHATTNYCRYHYRCLCDVFSRQPSLPPPRPPSLQ